MFVRVTILQCDPVQQGEVERLWLEESRPQALAQKGNLGARAFRSLESPGQLLMIGEWESLPEADAYLRRPEHQELMAKFAPYIQGPLQRYVGELIE